mgnify:CR=1 FL=1
MSGQTSPVSETLRRKLLSRLANSLAEWQERQQYDVDTAAEIILGDLESVGFAQTQAGEDLKHVRSALETLSDPLLIGANGVGMTRLLNLVCRMREIAATALLHLPATGPDTSTDCEGK